MLTSFVLRFRTPVHRYAPVNKQLNDKERVAAALENKHLLGVVHGCLATSAQRGAGTKMPTDGSPLLTTS